jgi:RNA recognition motif-containing protein
MQAMPMLCQQGAYFMMVPIAPAVLPNEANCNAAHDAETIESEPARTTTLVLRKLPKDLSSIQLRRMLDSADFEGLYDFIYVPMNFKSARNLGYALVNFTNHEHALAAQEHLHGARMGQAALVAELSCKHNGLNSLIEQYQSSHVLTDESLPDEYKPQLLRDGKVIPFPVAVSADESADEC